MPSLQLFSLLCKPASLLLHQTCLRWWSNFQTLIASLSAVCCVFMNSFAGKGILICDEQRTLLWRAFVVFIICTRFCHNFSLNTSENTFCMWRMFCGRYFPIRRACALACSSPSAHSVEFCLKLFSLCITSCILAAIAWNDCSRAKCGNWNRIARNSCNIHWKCSNSSQISSALDLSGARLCSGSC